MKTEPSLFVKRSAEVVISFALFLALATVLGVWLKLFVMGWILASCP